MRERVALLAAGLCCLVAVAGCGSVSTASTSHSTRADRGAVSPPAATRRPSRSCPRAVRGLGMIAVAARERLELVDLATCQTRVLARTNVSEVRFSADGRWVAYERSSGYFSGYASSGPLVVSVHGGPARSPLSVAVVAWSWAHTSDLLCGITAQGSLVAVSPAGTPGIVSECAGAPLGGLSPTAGVVVVNRSRCGQSVGELDTINVRTGARTVVIRQLGRFFTFAGFSPDGRWLLFWTQDECGVSLAADGLPLEVVPVGGGRPIVAVRHMLHYPDFLSWCGGRLIAAAGSSRETNTGSSLVVTGPPGWHQRTIDPARKLSWDSPSCSSSGRVLAAAAGPNNAPVSFGREHRSIWVLHPDGHRIRRLTRPPADLSDEAPRFSRDGRWIVFVRTRVVTVGQSAISKDIVELTRTGGTGGAVPVISFTSDDFSYYDHFNWPEETAWFSGRRRAPLATPISACRMGQLVVRRGHSMAGLGSAGEYLSFTNASKRSCRIGGWPTLALINARGAVSHSVIRVPERPPSYTSPARAAAFILRPRQHADAAFAGSDGPTKNNRPCGPSYRKLRVGLPGSSETRILSAWIPYLDAYMPDCSQIALGPLAPSSALYHG